MPLQLVLDAAHLGLGQSPAPQGGAFSMVFMLVVMFAIIYFLMIRPQQKQQKRHRDFLSTLKKGDEVVTQAGIIGRVFAIEENIVQIELGDKVKMRVLKQAVSSQAPGHDGSDTDKTGKN